MVTRGLMDALLRDPTAARKAGKREGVWGGGRAGGGDKGVCGGDYKLARMGGRGWRTEKGKVVSFYFNLRCILKEMVLLRVLSMSMS